MWLQRICIWTPRNAHFWPSLCIRLQILCDHTRILSNIRRQFWNKSNILFLFDYSDSKQFWIYTFWYQALLYIYLLCFVYFTPKWYILLKSSSILPPCLMHLLKRHDTTNSCMQHSDSKWYNNQPFLRGIVLMVGGASAALLLWRREETTSDCVEGGASAGCVVKTMRKRRWAKKRLLMVLSLNGGVLLYVWRFCEHYGEGCVREYDWCCSCRNIWNVETKKIVFFKLYIAGEKINCVYITCISTVFVIVWHVKEISPLQ